MWVEWLVFIIRFTVVYYSVDNMDTVFLSNIGAISFHGVFIIYSFTLDLENMVRGGQLFMIGFEFCLVILR